MILGSRLSPTRYNCSLLTLSLTRQPNSRVLAFAHLPKTITSLRARAYPSTHILYNPFTAPFSQNTRTKIRNSYSTMASFVELKDGRKLYYQLSGPSSSPIVLLSNSLCSPYATWDHFVPRLQALNLQVLRYDQIGHGQSTVNPSTVDATTFNDLSDDVKQLISSLKIKKLYAWIGISMGAAT
jgi:hypothetical protein